MQTAAIPPLSFTIDLPDEEERRCETYGRGKFLFALTEFLLVPALLVAFTLSGGSVWLLARCRPAGASDWLRDLIFLFVVGVLIRTILLPLHFLNEHWLDRRFGISRQSAPSWAWEWLCRSVVYGLATLALLFLVMESLRWKPWLVGPWSLGFVICRSLFYDFVYYPLLALFYPVRLLRKETFTLPGHGKRTLPVYEVQVSHKTSRANAAIRLRGNGTSIYVTDTLLQAFTEDEERVVLAHEFGHLYDQLHLEERTRAGIAQAHRKFVLGSAQLLAGIVSLCIVHVASPALHLGGAHDLAALPLFVALTLLFAQLFSPLLCAEARKDERDADEYALEMTGDVESYVSVMRKLRSLNLEERNSSRLSRFLFDTHPSYQERLDLAVHYRRRHHPKRKAAPPLRAGHDDSHSVGHCSSTQHPEPPQHRHHR